MNVMLRSTLASTTRTEPEHMRDKIYAFPSPEMAPVLVDLGRGLPSVVSQA